MLSGGVFVLLQRGFGSSRAQTFFGVFLVQVRVLEVFIAVLVLLIAVCFMVELGIASPPVGEVVQGLLVPRFSGRGATGIAISLLGAVVMP